MEFRILGPVEIRAAGQVLGTGHARQRAVLAVLLIDLGRVVSADLLIDRIWGDNPPPSVRNVLSGYVTRIRAAISGAAADPVALRRGQGGYVLQADPEQVDLHRFRELVGQATATGGRAEELLRDALRLWHGPALAGLDSPWLNAMRHTLELERHAAQLDLNDIRLRLGQHAALTAELAGQVTAAPTDERLISQLMLALYRSGRQADALGWFDQTRRHLADQLGADPGPVLRDLHAQILRADPALNQSEDLVRRAQPAVAVPRELPADVSAFTGRSAELTSLDELLLGGPKTSAAVISAVSGTAGVGKTALAIHWAHHAAVHFPDGQLYVNLRGHDPAQPLTAAEALAGFLRSLGLPARDIPADEAGRAARYRSLLAGKRILIVLDNAATAEQARSLLAAGPSCAVLVTSRDSLAGLVVRDGARRIDIDLLPLGDAIALLRELIGERADAEPGAVTELAEQCARLPLALRVAAELATSRPAAAITDLVAELADEQTRLHLLQAGDDLRSAIRAVFSWSYEQLDSHTARSFRLAGLHPGPDLDAYALTALADSSIEQTNRTLDILNGAHLIEMTTPGRYAMHDLLRAYARELAAQDGADEERAALTRLFDHYLHSAAVAMDTLFPAERDRRPRIPAPASPVPVVAADSAAARAWLNSELATLVTVSRHTAGHGWPAHATRLSATVYRYLDTTSSYAEATTIHGHALQASRLTGDRPAEADALVGLAIADWRRGNLERAAAGLRQALAIYGDVGDLTGQARALHSLGLVSHWQGSYEQAAANFQAALSLFQERGHQQGQASALTSLGTVDELRGNYEQAAYHHRQALSLYREIGHKGGAAVALANLGLIDQRTGRYQDAADHHLEALALHREVGNRQGEGAELVNLGKARGRQGYYRDAADHYVQALIVLREIGSLADEADALNDLGDALLADTRHSDASVHYAAALDLSVEVGTKYQQARAYDGLGKCSRASGENGLAHDQWQHALALYAELGVPEADQVRARLAAPCDGT